VMPIILWMFSFVFNKMIANPEGDPFGTNLRNLVE
jgi:hypothetical protein